MRPIHASSVALLTLLLAGTAAAQGPRPWASKVPPDLVRKANPAPNTPETIEAGKVVYANTCLPCHGEGAQGDGPAAQFIVPPPKPLLVNGKLSVPDGVAFWVITNGIDGTGMASLADSLSETERWQVIRYLQSMAAPAPAASPAAVNANPAASPVSTAAPASTPAAKPTAAPKKPTR